MIIKETEREGDREREREREGEEKAEKEGERNSESADTIDSHLEHSPSQKVDAHNVIDISLLHNYFGHIQYFSAF